MPFVSRKQAAWGNSPAGRRALGDVAEWNASTDFSSLPERSDVDKKPKHWIHGVVSHPGALTKAARAHGVSKLQEADKESHSANTSTRARGILGRRFIKKTI